MRYRFQKRGHKSIYLPDIRAPEFDAEYAKAIASISERKQPAADTFDVAIDLFYKTRGFQSLALSTQQNYKRRLGHIGDRFGEYSIKTLERKHLIQILNQIESPQERNRTLSIFKNVLQASVEAEVIPQNVAASIPRAKIKTDGYSVWSRAEIAQYLDHHKPGTMARRALLILYYTGQRGSDVAVMGPHNLKKDRIRVKQVKTKNAIDIPIHPLLKSELPESGETWLTTPQGKPFSVKGFQQWFVRQAKAAGIHGRSAHGLRKALATHLAESGASPSEIQAVTGHKTLSEVTRYTDAANRADLADTAFKRLK